MNERKVQAPSGQAGWHLCDPAMSHGMDVARAVSPSGIAPPYCAYFEPASAV
jgi:hypothetical protein